VRKSLPKVFAHGVFGDTDPSDECLFVFEKTGDDQKLLVLLNFTAEAKPIDIAERLGNSPPKAIIKNYEDEPLDFLRPLEGRVYLLDK
jgi:glycosidase